MHLLLFAISQFAYPCVHVSIENTIRIRCLIRKVPRNAVLIRKDPLWIYTVRLPYGSIFGGAVLLTREQFQKVNGFSNQFFGWGGEDDDMWNRVKSNGYSVIRYPVSIARYRMIKHGPDKGNEANPQRMALINQGAKRYKTDGINSLKYKVLKLEFRKLYTRVYISVNQSEIMKN